MASRAAHRRVFPEKWSGVGLTAAGILLALCCNGRTAGLSPHDAGVRREDSGTRTDAEAANAAGGGGGSGGEDFAAGGSATTTSDADVAGCETCAEERCDSLLRACRTDAACSAAFDSYVRCEEGHICIVTFGAAIAPDGSQASPFAQCIVAQCSLGPCPGGNPI
jgi:hypothetical protein